MASLAEYGAALRLVQGRAEALGLGFAGAAPRALFVALRTSLPVLSQPCEAFRRPGQIRAHARVRAECEELLVAVAAALHSRDAEDERRAVDEAQRFCRLIAALGVALAGPWS
jgi:hypothetical protein